MASPEAQTAGQQIKAEEEKHEDGAPAQAPGNVNSGAPKSGSNKMGTGKGKGSGKSLHGQDVTLGQIDRERWENGDWLCPEAKCRAQLCQ